MIPWHLFSFFYNRVSQKDGGWLGLMVLQSGFPLMMIWAIVKLVIMLLALDEYTLKGDVLLPIWFLRGLSVNFKDHCWNRAFWFFYSVWNRDCIISVLLFLLQDGAYSHTSTLWDHNVGSYAWYLRISHGEKRNRARSVKFLPWARDVQTVFRNSFYVVILIKGKLVL